MEIVEASESNVGSNQTYFATGAASDLVESVPGLCRWHSRIESIEVRSAGVSHLTATAWPFIEVDDTGCLTIQAKGSLVAIPDRNWKLAALPGFACFAVGDGRFDFDSKRF